MASGKYVENEKQTKCKCGKGYIITFDVVHWDEGENDETIKETKYTCPDKCHISRVLGQEQQSCVDDLRTISRQHRIL